MSGSSHTRRDSEVKKGDGNTPQHALSNASQSATPTKSHTPVRKSSLKPASKSLSPIKKKRVPSDSHSGKGVKIEGKVRVILDHSDSESGSPSERGTEKRKKGEEKTVYNEKDEQKPNSRVKSTSGNTQLHRDKEHAPLEFSKENIRKKLNGDLKDYMCLFFTETSPGQRPVGQYFETFCYTFFSHLVYNHNDKADHWQTEVQQLVEKKIQGVSRKVAGLELLYSQIDKWVNNLEEWEQKRILEKDQPDDWLTKMAELSNTRSFDNVKDLGLLFKYENVKAKPAILRPRPDQQELLNALAFVLHKKIVEAVLDHYYRYHRKQANGNQKELAAALQENAKKAETKLKDMHIDSKLLGEKWVYINEIENLTVEDIENMGIEFEDPHKQEIRVSVLKKNGIRVKKVSDKDSEKARGILREVQISDINSGEDAFIGNIQIIFGSTSREVGVWYKHKHTMATANTRAQKVNMRTMSKDADGQ
ncbi:uncharacterized protein FOMMEDRAFT_25033 [Fomitiporia mediterranea MF3/22]|uniref:uncharacterized protein n=1 Tax=Fomitiporia mediterranea (strain MF3/22) TaxID=694068 RepID=UPI0004407F06|nr:uncharacterized protein FOMMEDRAFT_25033 [Fomitiporia mediterranea MF3/22]EJD07745.1 hypothetical protein FOMMEDRAFT_25033 [Fomitiporia mediterranea MF3/22]